MNYAVFTFISLPIAGILSVRLSDMAFDVLKSIRPLIVSLGNFLSSSEPLREMRSDLQKRIREIVDELGPTVFPDFQELKELNKPKSPPQPPNFTNFNEVAVKLGRNLEMIRDIDFGEEGIAGDAYRAQFGDGFDKIEF